MASFIRSHHQELLTDICSPKLFPGLMQGCIIGAIQLIMAISFANIIFSGPLSPFAPRAAGMYIFGAAALSLTAALFSSFSTMISHPQDTPAAILSIAAAAIAIRLADASPQTQFATVSATAMSSAAVTALFFWFIGHFELSNIARFLPYPVIGGFLAGSGSALMIGSLGVMTGSPLSWSTLPHYLCIDLFYHWGPGVFFAVFIFFLMRRTPHYLILPGSLCISVLLFFLIVAMTDISIIDLRANGWLPVVMHSGQIWPAFDLETMESIHWPSFISQLPTVFTVALLALMGKILNLNGIELGARQDIDLDKELRVEAFGNILSSLGGGFAGYQSLSLSMLGPRSKTVTRIIPLTASMVSMAALFFGARGLSFLPKPLLGGLLFLLGFFFVESWLITGWKRLSPADYLIVLVIVVTIVAKGFLIGVSLGLGLTIIIFMFRFTRIPVIKEERTLTDFKSSTERSIPDKIILSRHGRECTIVQLTGYLFFGSSYFLGKRVKEILERDLPSKRIILDLGRIHGFDISAVSTFQRMGQQCLSRETQIILVASPRRLLNLLERNAAPEVMARFTTFPAMDAALEIAENEILSSYHKTLEGGPESASAREELFHASVDDLENHLQRQERLEKILDGMEGFIKRRTLQRGEILVKEDVAPEQIFLVLWGSVSLFVEDGQGNPHRIEVLGPGQVIAPQAAWTSQPSKYTARVEHQAMVAEISREDLITLEHRNKETAMLFYRFLARILARSR